MPLKSEADEHGRFGSIDELVGVDGIGPKKLEQFKELLEVR